EIFNRLRSGDWDYVILQSDFYESQTNRDNYVNYGSIMVDSVRAVGAIPVSYICWSINGNITNNVAESGLRLCRQKNIAGIPVNMAFRSVLQETNEISMYVDWIHTSKAGGYLAGLTFFTSFFGKSPRNLPALYGITDSSMIRYFQSIAWQAVMADSLADIRMPWQNPSPLPVRTEIIAPDTLSQYLSIKLRVATTYSDSSRDTSYFGRYKSLNSLILDTRYDGTSTAMTPGVARVVVEYVNTRDTATIEVKFNNATLDSIRIFPRNLVDPIDDGMVFSVTGYFHSSTASFSRNLTSSVTWGSDTTLFKMVNGAVKRTSGRADTLFLSASVNEIKDSIQLRFTPSLNSISRILFKCDTVSPAIGWRGEYSTRYDSVRGIGWINPNGIGCRADRSGTIFQKSFVQPAAETEYKIKCLDADYIIKMSVGDNLWGSNTDTSYIRFGNDTLVKYAGKGNYIVIDTIRVFGNDGIHLFIKGKPNYIVAITKQGVDINDVALDGGLPVTETENDLSLNVSEDILDAYPNPFNPVVTIRLGAGSHAAEKLIIRDVRGTQCAVLISKNGFAEWNAENYPSGIYFVERDTIKRTKSLRLLLIR
ncbi:MAG: hypothetical protein JNL74_21050, partial [Fibrobacteres bacterium]|nr:hypothetical protein [Fibrobacterota bacterium]